MSVYYKFKSNLDCDKVTFDGLHISIGDLKKSILQQKKIGKSNDFDLQITNAQTKEVYRSDDILIQKNTTVVVARVPNTGAKKPWKESDQNSVVNNNSTHITLDNIIKSSDLSNLDESEEEKIKTMMTQSTQDYDSSKFVKTRSMIGPVPPNYTCFRCGKGGHYIKHCPTNQHDVKRSTGIPRSFMMPAEKDQKGVLLARTGEYVVPIIDHEAYKETKKEKPPFVPVENPIVETKKVEKIPEELQCQICKNILHDAVMIPCCGNSYCDECIRTVLLESEHHQCPACQNVDISPDSLLPNRYLRNAVNKYNKNTRCDNKQDFDYELVSEKNGDQNEKQSLTDKVTSSPKNSTFNTTITTSNNVNTTITTSNNVNTTITTSTTSPTTTIEEQKKCETDKDHQHGEDVLNSVVKEDTTVEKTTVNPTNEGDFGNNEVPTNHQNQNSNSHNGYPQQICSLGNDTRNIRQLQTIARSVNSISSVPPPQIPQRHAILGHPPLRGMYQQNNYSANYQNNNFNNNSNFNNNNNNFNSNNGNNFNNNNFNSSSNNFNNNNNNFPQQRNMINRSLMHHNTINNNMQFNHNFNNSNQMIRNFTSGYHQSDMYGYNGVHNQISLPTQQRQPHHNFNGADLNLNQYVGSTNYSHPFVDHNAETIYKKYSDDYEDPLDKFAKQLEERNKANQINSRSDLRSRSKSRNRRSRSNSSSWTRSSSTYSSNSSSSRTSTSSSYDRSRSRSIYSRKKSKSFSRKSFNRSRTPRRKDYYNYDYNGSNNHNSFYRSSRRSRSRSLLNHKYNNKSDTFADSKSNKSLHEVKSRRHGHYERRSVDKKDYKTSRHYDHKKSSKRSPQNLSRHDREPRKNRFEENRNKIDEKSKSYVSDKHIRRSSKEKKSLKDKKFFKDDEENKNELKDELRNSKVTLKSENKVNTSLKKTEDEQKSENEFDEYEVQAQEISNKFLNDGLSETKIKNEINLNNNNLKSNEKNKSQDVENEIGEEPKNLYDLIDINVENYSLKDDDNNNFNCHNGDVKLNSDLNLKDKESKEKLNESNNDDKLNRKDKKELIKNRDDDYQNKKSSSNKNEVLKNRSPDSKYTKDAFKEEDSKTRKERKDDRDVKRYKSRHRRDRDEKDDKKDRKDERKDKDNKDYRSKDRDLKQDDDKYKSREKSSLNKANEKISSKDENISNNIVLCSKSKYDSKHEINEKNKVDFSDENSEDSKERKRRSHKKQKKEEKESREDRENRKRKLDGSDYESNKKHKKYKKHKRKDVEKSKKKSRKSSK